MEYIEWLKDTTCIFCILLCILVVVMKNKRIIALIAFLVGWGAFFYKPPMARADITTFKDTLSTSRLSIIGRVGSTSGSSFTFNATPSTPAFSTSSANLTPGDTVYFSVGSNGTVGSIVSSTTFTTTSVPSPTPTTGSYIYYKSIPTHTITLTTTDTVPNGSFLVKIPASATNSDNNLPDIDGFDFNTTPTVAGTDVTGYNFMFEAATESASCTAGYHCFVFPYAGTGVPGSVTLTIGNLIAPAPASGHDIGVADTYAISIEQYESGASTPSFTSASRIALLESVRVSATVDPSISFSITGVAASTTACGVSTSIATDTTTALSVPFGSMTLNTFKQAAHNLLVSTNANNGYAVTAIENHELSLNGGDPDSVAFIADTPCDTGPCTISSEQNWATATNNGFGYSLESVSGATVPFTAGGSFSARKFANADNADSPQTIMSSTAKSNSHVAHVCYRLSVGATQEAGDYENMVTYTATATF